MSAVLSRLPLSTSVGTRTYRAEDTTVVLITAPYMGLGVPNKVSKRRVNAPSLGERRGVTVPISRQLLEEMGVDPDADIEVNRRPYDTERNPGEMGLRLFEKDDE